MVCTMGDDGDRWRSPPESETQEDVDKQMAEHREDHKADNEEKKTENEKRKAENEREDKAAQRANKLALMEHETARQAARQAGEAGGGRGREEVGGDERARPA
jgi:hypothetical protein